MKLRVFVFSLVVLSSLCSYSFADIPWETAAEYVVSADAHQINLHYTDGVGTIKPTVEGTTILTTVTSMYGFDPLPNLPDWNYTSPGIAKTYTYPVTNEGNTSHDVVEYACHIIPGGATGFDGYHWTVTITSESGYGFTYFDGTQHIPTGYYWGAGMDGSHPLLKSESRKVYVIVTPSAVESESPDGAYLLVTFEVISNDSDNAGNPCMPAGIYVGANSKNYGGFSDVTDETRTVIRTSKMTMTRTVTIDSPVAYKTFANAQLGGDHSHDPVPGAVATFILTYNNTASAVATQVVIMDKVPPSTEAAHINAYIGNQAGLPNVTLSAYAPTAAPTWTAYYSTSASPGIGYNNLTGWITVNANLVPSSFATGSGIKYIKWESSAIPTSEANKTLNWGVMIR